MYPSYRVTCDISAQACSPSTTSPHAWALSLCQKKFAPVKTQNSVKKIHQTCASLWDISLLCTCSVPYYSPCPEWNSAYAGKTNQENSQSLQKLMDYYTLTLSDNSILCHWHGPLICFWWDLFCLPRSLKRPCHCVYTLKPHIHTPISNLMASFMLCKNTMWVDSRAQFLRLKLVDSSLVNKRQLQCWKHWQSLAILKPSTALPLKQTTPPHIKSSQLKFAWNAPKLVICQFNLFWGPGPAKPWWLLHKVSIGVLGLP